MRVDEYLQDGCYYLLQLEDDRVAMYKDGFLFKYDGIRGITIPVGKKQTGEEIMNYINENKL